MNTSGEAHTARCACGACTITVTAPPQLHGVCHCDHCKQRTGSAFGISMYFKRSDVAAIEGDTKVYAFHHERQNHDQERHFCARCGTTLYWSLSVLPDRIGIAGGCFDGAPFGEPNMSVTHGKKFGWVGLPDAWRVAMD